MMTPMTSRAISLLLLAASFPASYQTHAAEESSGQTVQEVLAVAKIAGACGILDSQIHFQKTTKMPGGDEFVSRFWAVEAARLGLSIQQLSERCNSAVTIYDEFWKSMEPESR